LPTRLGVQFKLVRFYYAQRRAGHPRSSPRRFAAVVGVADIGRFGFADAFSDPILAFALSGRELLGAIFHRALPCAMGFLPRWGVKKFAAT
jgi:hypothetical protein